MRCPQCNSELRRDTHDPKYGMCDNCKKAFTWEPANEPIQQPQYDQQTQYNQQQTYQQPPYGQYQLPPKKKHGCLIAVLVCVGLLVGIVILIALFSSGNKQQDSTIPETITETEPVPTEPTTEPEAETPEAEAPEVAAPDNVEPEKEAPDESSNDGVIDLEIPDLFHVKYLRHEVSKDFEDKPVIIVYFEYTNLAPDATNFMFSVGDKSFQSGIELDIAIMTESPEEYHNSILDVQTGATLNVAIVRSLRDTTSPVTMEIYDLLDFFGDEDRTDSMELTIQ